LGKITYVKNWCQSKIVFGKLILATAYRGEIAGVLSNPLPVVNNNMVSPVDESCKIITLQILLIERAYLAVKRGIAFWPFEYYRRLY